MARFAALIVALAACSGGTGGGSATDAGDAGSDSGRLVWTWSFVDPATQTEVGCPANVPTVDVVAFYTRSNGECSQPNWAAAKGTFACSQGMGAIDPKPRGTNLCLSASVYDIHVIANTDDGLRYAEERQGIVLPDGASGDGHTDIESPRGFIRLTWTLVGSDGMPRPCPSSAVIQTSLASWFGDRQDCTLGSAVLTGVLPGSYDVAADLLWGASSFNSYGQGRVTGVTVTAGEITDAAVTIVLQ